MMRRTMVGLVIAAMIVGGATMAVAQSGGEGAGRGHDAIPHAISFEFQGGTAVQYAEAVRNASGQKKVVVMPGCNEYVMPAVELKDVSVEGALGALEYATPLKEGNQTRLNVNREADVFVVVPSGRWTGEDERQTAVFSLAEMVDGGTVAAGDVLTAVEAVLELAGDAEPLMRYHAETRLLMVRGTEAELNGVARVLDGVRHSASAIQAGTQKDEETRRELEETRAALAAAKQSVDQAERYAAEIEKVAEDGGAGPLDVLRAREDLIQRQREQAELESHVRILEERLERQTGGKKGADARLSH